MLMAILIGWQIGAQLLRSAEGTPGQARTEILTWSRVSVVTPVLTTGRRNTTRATQLAQRKKVPKLEPGNWEEVCN